MWRLRHVEAERTDTCGGWVFWHVWRLSVLTHVEAECSDTCGGWVFWHMWRLSVLTRVEAERTDTCGGWVYWHVWRLSVLTRVEAECSDTCGGCWDINNSRSLTDSLKFCSSCICYAAVTLPAASLYHRTCCCHEFDMASPAAADTLTLSQLTWEHTHQTDSVPTFNLLHSKFRWSLKKLTSLWTDAAVCYELGVPVINNASLVPISGQTDMLFAGELVIEVGFGYRWLGYMGSDVNDDWDLWGLGRLRMSHKGLIYLMMIEAV